MDYGSSDTSTTSLGANQFPISEVYVPNGTLTALEGGPSSTDLGGKKSAPASMYVKDGSDVAQGTTTDAANANTVVGQLKQIQANTNGSATAANQTTANTSLSSVATNTSNTATNTSNINTATGTRTDSKATDGSVTAWSVIALLKGIIDKLLSTLAVTQSGTWTVQPGNTANTTAWKVDGSGVTQPVSGTVTANAGTGTFTNQQSNIQTDYDTGVGTQNMTMYGVALPASGGSVAGGTASNPLRTDPTGTTIQPVSGTITANAGTNLNTSLLALESGGNLASAKTDLDNISTVSGATTDVAVVGDNTGTVSAKLRGLTKILNDIWDSVNHRIKVDGSGVTQPVSGTVTANAGTNLNTSLLALESGGHLANIDTHTPALGSATSASSSPVVIASDQGAVALKRSTVAVFTQASGVTSGSTQNSGDLTVGPYTEISLDINTTAQSGTSPTIQYFYERKGADNIYYVLWQSAVLSAAANTLSTSIGSGMAYNQSLGLTGRLRWVVGGSATPTFTHSLNLYGK